MPNSAVLRRSASTWIADTGSAIGRSMCSVGTLWSSVATVSSGRRTRRPPRRRPSNACGLVTSCTRWRSMYSRSGSSGAARTTWRSHTFSARVVGRDIFDADPLAVPGSDGRLHVSQMLGYSSYFMESVSNVGVLDKAVHVVRAIEELGPQTLLDLQASTGLPRATLHRLAVALETHGLLRREGSGRFCLGLGL